MNDWIQWVIGASVLVSAASWIIYLMVNQQGQQNAPRRSADDGAGVPRRRASEDLERFLDEVKRRKKQTGEKVYEEVVVVPAPAPAPRRPSQSQQPPRRKPPPRRAETVLAAEIVTEPAPVARVVEVAPKPTGPARATGRPEDTYRTTAPAGRGSQTPVAVTVRQLLNEPRSLGAAFLLREILDRPLSQRRGQQR